MRNQRWLNFLFLGFLAYVLIVGNFRRHDEEKAAPAVAPAPEQMQEAKPEKEYPALNEFANVERWKKALNPEYKKLAESCTYTAPEHGLPMKVTLDADGDGSPASCAANITVALKIWDAAGKTAKERTVPVILGEHKLSAPLEAALVGIRVNGARTIVLPPDAKAAPFLKSDHVLVVTATRVD